mgnify:CR=1 FL=1
MIASFPSTLQPPEPLRLYFRWLEAEDAIDISPVDGAIFSKVSPDQPDYSMLIKPVDPRFASTWLASGPDQTGRLAAFVRSGGDGSHAAMWRNEGGGLSFVHLGSGSGSTLLCRLTDDPVDFLRLLAIGYEELCWPEAFDQTPEEAEQELTELRGGKHNRPLKMRHWVETTFNVIVPDRASEIISNIALMDDEYSDDPFWQWMRKIQGY